MTKLLACPNCGSPDHLRAWYLDPVAYDLARLSPGEKVFADTAPEIGERGWFDNYLHKEAVAQSVAASAGVPRRLACAVSGIGGRSE